MFLISTFASNACIDSFERYPSFVAFFSDEMTNSRSLRLFLATVLLFKSLTHSQLQFSSPCPGIFEYEQEKGSDRWYGLVTLSSDANLAGVWLRVVLDGPSAQLGVDFKKFCPPRIEELKRMLLELVR